MCGEACTPWLGGMLGGILNLDWGAISDKGGSEVAEWFLL